LYNQEIDLEGVNGNRFRLSYAKGEDVVSGEYSFNEIISNPDFDLKILKTESFSPDAAGQDYYFKINSTGAILSYLRNNLTAQIVNPDARTVSISFQDHNPAKARDIVNTVDSVYLALKRETKNQSNEQTISFLRD